MEALLLPVGYRIRHRSLFPGLECQERRGSCCRSARRPHVALTQTARSRPFFVLALPASSIGDVVDRRKLILFTEAWMIGIAILLATTTTIAGLMSPWFLLVLTFAISAGDAFETPTWRAVIPELVPKDGLPAASALNGMEFNFARAGGPALAGALISTAGVGTTFVVNAISFTGVFLIIARWEQTFRLMVASLMSRWLEL